MTASADDPRPTAPAVTSGEVWSVGHDDFGQLGRKADGFDVALGPVRSPTGRGTLTGVKALAAGERHSLALLTDGRVLAWGSNSNGQLGNGTSKPSAVPVAVHAPDGRTGRLGGVTSIAAAGNLSVALLGNGQVVTWGAGGSGQRGIGTTSSPAVPTTVRAPDGAGPLTGVTAIAAADQACLAALRDGGVVSWGGNLAGILGTAGVTARALPAPVTGVGEQARLTGVVEVAAGNKHAIARLRDGRVLSWGKNDRGQLGDGTVRGRWTPGPVVGPSGGEPLGDVAAIAAGGKHNYALLKDGTVMAWGSNGNGQLGVGGTRSSARPVQVKGTYTPKLRGVTGVEAGNGFGVALLAGGSALTWGADGKGQLGAGSRLPRSRPGPLILAQGARAGTFVAAAAGGHHLLILMQPRDGR
ncbi:RCC1-like domain-containing protein [Actinomadura algeriensis]|uniref:Alpha-tubulin suppressor-like RCC1 family protein n=1 Tax=Actinomadura algeriensis TaxID=1679523 RepID=A0ABR9JU90_9ACTN|nr:RCC1 domain-containing protein [Actinomadura algeriensis]MBE1534073.1 alpha-tubulin suppressor-like RCC1 family protein [Actinomadura algeriensis]